MKCASFWTLKSSSVGTKLEQIICDISLLAKGTTKRQLKFIF